MNLLTIILILLIFTGVSSSLAFIPGMIENLEIFKNVLIHEIFSILLVPIYLASVTVLFKKKIETSERGGILFLIAIFSILVAVNIVFRDSSTLWQAFTRSDHATRIIAITIVSLAIIVYFGSYFIIARLTR